MTITSVNRDGSKTGGKNTIRGESSFLVRCGFESREHSTSHECFCVIRWRRHPGPGNSESLDGSFWGHISFSLSSWLFSLYFSFIAPCVDTNLTLYESNPLTEENRAVLWETENKKKKEGNKKMAEDQAIQVPRVKLGTRGLEEVLSSGFPDSLWFINVTDHFAAEIVWLLLMYFADHN